MCNKIQDYEGSTYKVIHCEKAVNSFYDAASSIKPVRKRQTLENFMVKLIRRIANRERLSTASYAPEGRLPEKAGKFYALKKIPIRGYCWQSKKYPGTIFISHYIFKNKQKLDKKDIEKVASHWKLKEK